MFEIVMIGAKVHNSKSTSFRSKINAELENNIACAIKISGADDLFKT